MDLLEIYKKLLANREMAYNEAITARNRDNDMNLNYIKLLHHQNALISRGQGVSTSSIELAEPTSFLVEGDTRFYNVGGRLLILKKVLTSAGMKEKVLRPHLISLTEQVKKYLCDWSKKSPENGEPLKSTFAWVHVTHSLQEALVTLNLQKLVSKVKVALNSSVGHECTLNSETEPKDSNSSDMDLDTEDSLNKFFE